MLSILIPTYNYNVSALAKSLYQQLQSKSIVYEVLIFDDSSTREGIVINNKEQIALLEGFNYIMADKNIGRAAARNLLAQKAQYDRLLFMDADVLPKNDDFIEKFDIKNLKADLVFGGITYEETRPEKDKILRWKYGWAREVKPLSQRIKNPYTSIIAQCFLVRKNIFLSAGNFFDNIYGEDILYAYNYQKMRIKVVHIDSPIIHYGLEPNSSFISKTKEGLDSLCYFEKEGMIPEDFRPIQRARLKLKKYYLLGLFRFVMKISNRLIEKNLNSGNPSLFLFDLYRLHYYIKLKKMLNNA